MKLLGRIRPEVRAIDRDSNNPYDLVRRRLNGTYVDVENSERLGAVFACRDLISRLVSTLPVDVFTKTGGVFQPVTPRVRFFDTPDPAWEVDITDWNYQIVDQALARGNAFGLVQDLDRQGYPSAVHLLTSSQVTVETKGSNGPPEWKVDGEPIRRWPAGGLWHLTAYTRPGTPLGMSPIERAALTIGIGLESLQFGANWFRNGAVPSAALTNDKEVSQAAARLAKQRFTEAVGSTREPVVLGNGWSYEQIAVAANESQFLETISANVADVCRFFGVMPEDIGGSSGDSMTYANVESRNLQLYVRTIGPWVVRIERALSRLRPNGQYVKFNVDALLRLDTQTRMKAYETAIRNGWMSVNDVRDLEDRPRIDGGDQYLWPPMRQQLTQEELDEGADTEDEAPIRANGHKEHAHV